MSLVSGSTFPPNFWRWVVALGLGFFAGVFTAIADSSTFPGFYTLFRDGVIEMVPALIALRMTLDKKKGAAGPAAK